VGVGKSTQRNKLYERMTLTYPDKRIEVTREPGGDEISEVLRSVVQGEIFSTFNTPMTAMCEATIYAASRAQTIPSVVIPALEKGSIVLADRSAMTSLAYQGLGRGLGISRIYNINDLVLDGFWPGLGIVLEVDLKTATSRAQDTLGDKFEKMGLDFFERAWKGYMEMGHLMKGIMEVEIVDGNGTIDEVHERVWSVAIGYLGLT